MTALVVSMEIGTLIFPESPESQGLFSGVLLPGKPVRHRAAWIPTDIQNIRTVFNQLEAACNGLFRRIETPPIREGIRSYIQDSHDLGSITQNHFSPTCFKRPMLCQKVVK